MTQVRNMYIIIHSYQTRGITIETKGLMALKTPSLLLRFSCDK